VVIACPHCRADTPVASGRCVVCSGYLSGDSAAVTLASPPYGFAPDQSLDATISSGSRQQGPASLSQSSGLHPGQLFASRYRIERQLGAGGMGAVYRAHDVELNVPVALKIIRAEILSNPATGRDFEQRFKQELLLARQVTHPNVLRIHDLGESGGIKYITMPLVEGSDLHSLLASGPLPFDQVVSIARQIAAGMAAAHDAGIAHRDLKPQNVLVDASGRAYISDFGLAKSYEASTAGLTRPGDFIGTPRYIAPEIVEGRPADHRSDLYALGLIFYEMASGTSPFPGESAIELLMQRIRTNPKDLHVERPELPEYFSRIVMRCLARDPAQRYQHAHQIVDDIDAHRSPSRGRSHPTVSINLPLPTPRGWLYAGIAIAAIVGLLAVPPVRQFVFRSGTTTAGIPSAAEKKLIAVLPFRTIGSQAGLEHIGSGVAEALSARLFGLGTVTVAPSSATDRVDPKHPLARIARELGSNLLVTGTVQGDAERISIVINVEEPLAERRVWTKQFAGVSKDLLTLQDQIFAGLVEALEVTPSTEAQARGASRPTNNIEAYDLYLKGRNTMRGQQDKRNVESAVKLYEDALRVDPRFALAFAGLADASVQMYSETKERLWADKAVAAAQQGKRLDENLVEVRIAAATAYLATGKFNEAIVELQQALKLAPNSDDAYRRLAVAYRRAGRVDDSRRMNEEAIRVNPYYWLNHNAMGEAALRIGDNLRAEQAFSKVIELEPDNVNGFNNLGAIYLMTGRYPEAATAFQRATELVPTADAYSNLGIAYAWQGRFQDALPPYLKAVETSPNVDGWLSNLGDGYRWLGQSDKANQTYHRAITLAYEALQVNPSDARTRSYLGTYYAKKGDTAQGIRLVKEAAAADPNEVSILYNVAVVHALAGQPGPALDALAKSLKAGYPPPFARDDPDLKALSKDRRFESLLREFRSAASR
jgi:serine/threonine protein kinase/tetratricopeptide (TPR) repeat protein